EASAFGGNRAKPIQVHANRTLFRVDSDPKNVQKKSKKTIDTLLFLGETGDTHGNTLTTKQMRTKALLCAEGLLAAGVATSMAQSNVYSLNVVGYINYSITNKFNLIANHLDFDGTGTNNTVQTVFGTNLPNGSQVFAFNPATQLYFQTATYIGNGNWSPAPGSTVAPGLQPGSGVWVRLIQANGTPTPITLTTVGNVIQGTHSLPIIGAVPAKFQFLSIIPPLSTGIQTGMGLTPTAGDQVFQFNPVTQ